MKTGRFINKHLYKKGAGIGTRGESQTIQGMSVSIQDILQKHSRGLSIRTDPRLTWAEEDGDESIRIKDLTDWDTIKATYKQIQAKKKLAEELSKKKKDNPTEEPPENSDGVN